MSRASEIEKALHAYQLANRIHNDSEAALHDAANAALALPPDPPGECCRRAFRRGVETMQDHVAKTGPDMSWVRSMPLPEEAVTPTAHDPQRYFALGKKAGAEAMREAAARYMDNQRNRALMVSARRCAAEIRSLPLPGAKEDDR